MIEEQPLDKLPDKGAEVTREGGRFIYKLWLSPAAMKALDEALREEFGKLYKSSYGTEVQKRESS
jgi:hypothetical protein